MTISKYSTGRDLSPEWQQWTAFRQGLTTRLADTLIRTYREAGGRGLVSAAVFGTADPLQNWRAWKGLDAALPMLYLPGTGLYPLALLQFYGDKDRVWPGVEVGEGRAPLPELLKVIREQGFRHVGVFGWEAPADARTSP